MGATDQMLARYVGEIEERQQFIDSVVEAAGGKDLSDEQTELVTETRNRISRVNELMKPLEEARRISGESTERIAAAREVHERQAGHRRRRRVPVCRRLHPRLLEGVARAEEAMTGSTSTTAPPPTRRPPTTPACSRTPDPRAGVNFIDMSRPLTTPWGRGSCRRATWSRPKVTQHTNVAVQPVGREERARQPEDADLEADRDRRTPTAATSTCRGRTSTGRRRRSWTS
jgi:hypothetical protein